MQRVFVIPSVDSSFYRRGQSVVLSPPHGIGSSNPAVSFSLARAPITLQSIAHSHNRHPFSAPEIAFEIPFTDADLFALRLSRE